jgi:hypothetical protein
MKKLLLCLSALLLVTPAAAQQGPPQGREGGMGRGRHEQGGPPRIRAIEPVERERFDRLVSDMFRAADSDRDGLVTIGEVRGVASARRDVLIGKRFEQVDRNSDRAVSRDEFFAWQHDLGSVAQSEEAQAIGRGIVPETIAPDFRNEMEARLLTGIIEPMGASLVVDANSNYDAGLALDELLAYEGKRFDGADRDRNKAISIDEAPRREGRLPGGVTGLPPPRQPEPPPGE